MLYALIYPLSLVPKLVNIIAIPDKTTYIPCIPNFIDIFILNLYTLPPINHNTT